MFCYKFSNKVVYPNPGNNKALDIYLVLPSGEKIDWFYQWYYNKNFNKNNYAVLDCGVRIKYEEYKFNKPSGGFDCFQELTVRSPVKLNFEN